MAYSRPILIAHLTLLTYVRSSLRAVTDCQQLRQVGLHESETPMQSKILLLWPWLYGFLPAGSMITAFGVSKFDAAFFAWNGLGCAPAGLRWRIGAVKACFADLCSPYCLLGDTDTWRLILQHCYTDPLCFNVRWSSPQKTCNLPHQWGSTAYGGKPRGFCGL